MSDTVLSAPIDLITTAVLDLLNASQRTVYDGAYGGDPINPTYPYGILYSLMGGNADPTPDLDADPQTVTIPYQVTSVSRLRNQAQQVARVFRDRLLARTSGGWLYPLTIPTGWRCIYRAPDPVMPGVDRVADTPIAVFTVPTRFTITVTPS